MSVTDQTNPPSAIEETPKEAPEPINRDRALSIVGRHVLAKLEDVMAAHQAVADDAQADKVRRENAKLVIGAARGLGLFVWRVVKAAERPRILRSPGRLRIVR